LDKITLYGKKEKENTSPFEGRRTIGSWKKGSN
jgi:hypothetical protein